MQTKVKTYVPNIEEDVLLGFVSFMITFCHLFKMQDC
jgi:hypothetical protein